MGTTRKAHGDPSAGRTASAAHLHDGRDVERSVNGLVGRDWQRMVQDSRREGTDASCQGQQHGSMPAAAAAGDIDKVCAALHGISLQDDGHVQHEEEHSRWQQQQQQRRIMRSSTGSGQSSSKPPASNSSSSSLLPFGEVGLHSDEHELHVNKQQQQQREQQQQQRGHDHRAGVQQLARSQQQQESSPRRGSSRHPTSSLSRAVNANREHLLMTLFIRNFARYGCCQEPARRVAEGGDGEEWIALPSGGFARVWPICAQAWRRPQAVWARPAPGLACSRPQRALTGEATYRLAVQEARRRGLWPPRPPELHPSPLGAGASAAAVDTADACTQPASVARSHLDPSAREPPPALHTDSRVARLMHAPWRWYERARSALSAAFPGESEMLGPPSLGMAPSGSFRGWWVSASRAHE